MRSLLLQASTVAERLLVAWPTYPHSRPVGTESPDRTTKNLHYLYCLPFFYPLAPLGVVLQHPIPTT